MATSPAPRRYTVDDLARFPDDGKRRELVNGEIVEWDVPNVRHNAVLNALAFLLTLFVRQRRLGLVTSGDTMVRIRDSDADARGGDIAFFAIDHLPRDVDAAATRTPPDFVIEVISPSDRPVDIQKKVRDWLRAGVRLLWYVDPVTGNVTVYEGASQAGHIVRYVGPDEDLTGGTVLPEFSVRLRDVLDELSMLDAPSEQ